MMSSASLHDRSRRNFFPVFSAALAALLLAAFGAPTPASALPSLLGPTPYLQFADSPFAGQSFSYFYLEDFEDSVLNTPGVAASGHCISPTSCFNVWLTDSVDADDGAIDGSGNRGHSFWANGSASFTFDAAVLGGLPTHVGVVWTDGSAPITFKAFDAANNLLGTLVGTGFPDSNFGGGTAEDRFFGIADPNGIAKILISDIGGIELDHLQYGRLGSLQIPEPDSLVLFAAGLIGLLDIVRRGGNKAAV